MRRPHAVALHRCRLPGSRRWAALVVLFPLALAGFRTPQREPELPAFLAGGRYRVRRGTDGGYRITPKRRWLRTLVNALAKVPQPPRPRMPVRFPAAKVLGWTRRGAPVYEIRGGATIVAAAGGGNWNAGGTWVGGVVPTAADNVQLNATSGAVTINAAAVCRSLDCTGYTGTLTHSAGITLSIGDATAGAGNIALKFVAGMTYTLGNVTTSAITFVSTSATTQSVNFAAKTTGNVTYGGAGGSWQLTGSHNTGATATVTHSFGTLDTNGQTCSWGLLNTNNSNVRTLSLGASAITITGTATAWSVGGTLLTFNANTSTITMAGSAGGPVFAGGGKTYNNVVISGGGTWRIDSANTFVNLTVTSSTAKTDWLNINNGDQIVTGTLTLTGNSAVNRLLVKTNTPGTTHSITAAAVSITNVDFMDITGAGAAAPFTGASVGDAGGNSGITFTAAVTRYAVVAGNWSATATWSATSGGAGGASVPLPQDTVRLDAASGAGTYTADMPRLGKDIDCTGFARTLNINSTTNSLYGSLTLASGMTLTGSQPTTLAGRGSHTITSAGLSAPQPMTQNGPGGTYTLQDALNLGTNRDLSITSGTFTANGFNVTAKSVTILSGGTLNLGSGTWTVVGTGTVWSANPSAIINPSTSLIDVTNTTATAKTFAGGGNTYGTLRYNVNSAATLTITGATTFANLIVSIPAAGSARTLSFDPNVDVVTGTLTLTGQPGALLTVNSTVPGTQATFSKASGTVIADYVSLQDTNATGGAAFYATHSTRGSNVTGWLVGQLLTLDEAAETDAARVTTTAKRLTVAEAIEADAARVTTTAKRLTVAEAIEADAARVLTPARRIPLSGAAEADAASAVTTAKRLPVAEAIEADAARPLTLARRLPPLEQAVESSAARGVITVRAFRLDEAIEADDARGLVVPKLAVLDQAIELDEAGAMVAPILLALRGSISPTVRLAGERRDTVVLGGRRGG